MLCICKSDLFPDGRQIQREILYRPISCRTALLLHGASDLIDQSLAIVADSDLFAAQILLLIMLRLCQVAAGGEECKAACKTGSSKKKQGLGLTNCKLRWLLSTDLTCAPACCCWRAADGPDYLRADFAVPPCCATWRCCSAAAASARSTDAWPTSRRRTWMPDRVTPPQLDQLKRPPPQLQLLPNRVPR